MAKGKARTTSTSTKIARSTAKIAVANVNKNGRQLATRQSAKRKATDEPVVQSIKPQKGKLSSQKNIEDKRPVLRVQTEHPDNLQSNAADLAMQGTSREGLTEQSNRSTPTVLQSA